MTFASPWRLCQCAKNRYLLACAVRRTKTRAPTACAPPRALLRMFLFLRSGTRPCITASIRPTSPHPPAQDGRLVEAVDTRSGNVVKVAPP